MFLVSHFGIDFFVNAYFWAGVLMLISPVLFLFASVVVLFRPCFGYRLGGTAGVIAVPWFVLTESSMMGGSSWTYVNGPAPWPGAPVLLAILKILSVGLIASAVTTAILRLPHRARLPQFPLSDRTWPAILVGFLVVAVWLSRSAMPWMLPGIVDRGHSADMRILHVQKRGLRFHETRILISTRDGRFGIRQYDRRLFQYGFRGIDRGGVLPEPTRDRAKELLDSPTLRNLHTPPSTALRSWNAEGWYIMTLHSPIQAFTSEFQTNPPNAVRDLLEQIAKLPAGGESSFGIQDVCLGFCFDPIAGLGFEYWNERCMTLPSGTMRCL